MGSHKTEKFSAAQTATAATSGFEIRPLARAVRGVLFASSATMAMAMPGMAIGAPLPAGCVQTNLETVTCAGSTAVPVVVTTTIQPDPINDLTVIIGDPLDPEGTSVDIAAAGYGVFAASYDQLGDATVINHSDITTYDGHAVIVDAGLDATVENNGAITANYGIGAVAAAYYGNAVITNNGSITSNDVFALGALATSKYNDALVTNNGDITANGDQATGVLAISKYEDATVVVAEGGSVDANSGAKYAAGVVAVVVAPDSLNDYATVDIAGTVTATSDYAAVGAVAVGPNIVATVAATGVITADAGSSADPEAYATGVLAEFYDVGYDGGYIDISVAGSVHATATSINDSEAIGVDIIGVSYGVYGNYSVGEILVSNTGADSITATATVYGENATAFAEGVYIEGGVGTVIDVYNSGSITATATASDATTNAYNSEAIANGVTVDAYDGLTITNALGGVISGEATTNGVWGDAYATGINVYSVNGLIAIVNDGAVTATATANLDDARATGIDVYAVDADIYIGGAGTIDATATGYEDADADGIDAYTRYGDIIVKYAAVGATATADGYGEVDADAKGIDVYANSGSVVVKYATMDVSATARSAYDDADADVEGIDADAAWGGTGYVAIIGVTGDVVARAYAEDDADAEAQGIDADSAYGEIYIGNVTLTSTAEATSYGYSGYADADADAEGIDAYAEFNVSLDYVAVTATATATAYDDADADAEGLDIYSQNGDINIFSAATTAMATATSADDDAYAEAKGAQLDTGWYSGGGIYVEGLTATVGAYATGDDEAGADAWGVDADGNSGVHIANADITVVATADATYDEAEVDAWGIDAYSEDGNISIYNALVDVDARATSVYDEADAEATGLEASTFWGNGYVEISGVTATVHAGAYGADETDADATGIDADTWGGNIYIDDTSATVTATASSSGYENADAEATGINADSYYGNIAVDVGASNVVSATATASSSYDWADADAVGVEAESYGGGDIRFSNAGDISADATATANPDYGWGSASATGVYIEGSDTVNASNDGTISATAYGDGAWATGMFVEGFDTTFVEAPYSAPLTVTNNGNIYATATGIGEFKYAGAIGIEAHGTGSEVNVVNGADGVVVATANATGTYGWAEAIAVHVSSDGDKYSNVTNHGLLAAYATGAYAEAFAVYAEGDAHLTVDNYGTMVGAIHSHGGDDTVNNFSGNTWFATGVSDLGYGDDVINNIYTDEYTAGRIVMTDATINLGKYASGNEFNNQGLLEAFGDNVIRMGNTYVSYAYVEGGQEYTNNPNAFNNTDGTISMIDGDVGDSLLLIGDFYSEGSSTLNVDVDGAAQIADTLYITGDVIAAGPTTVNGYLLTMPNAPEVLINVVSVAEGSAHAEGDFVAGELTVNPESFLTYELDGVFIPPSSPSQFVFSISATGLSDPGVTAAALSPAVQNLWQSGVGTLHQRQGAVRDQLLEKVSVWLRTYRTDGTLDPDGKQSNLEFDQENTGFELGIDAALNEELRLGLLFGQSEADVSMNDAAGSADIDGDTWGIYLTWMGTNGWYSDLSYRRMDFDGDAKSSGGKMDIDGEADGWNLEAGKTITLASGLQVEPQFQYTDMEVDLDDLVNTSGVFSQKDGDSTRARAGVMLRKAYQSGTAKWTPYGSLSVVEEFDGENSFNVAGGGYTGDSDIGGTSLLLETGVDAQFGDIIIYGGLNYQDGDALDSILGGQLGVRFSW